MNKSFLLSLFLLSLTLMISACSISTNNNHNEHDMNMEGDDNKTSPKDQSPKTIKDNNVVIVAEESNLSVRKNLNLPVWTFNGSVPGSEIRIREGEKITIQLKNKLPDPVSIHWHGLPVSNNMDGIPGVTMNAVQPGEEFKYEFTANVPGTYWYHSHQDGVNQVDKGLYGAFIVEPKDEKDKPDREFTLILDEWMSVGINSSNKESMDHSKIGHSEKENEEKIHDMSMYDLYTINGRSGSSVEPLSVKEGENVRIRLINAGYTSHKFHLHGHDFKIVATDGQPINSPENIKNKLISIAPGERYDIEFFTDNPGKWYFEAHGKNEANEGMKTFIQYEKSDNETDQPNFQEKLSVLDINSYGKYSESLFSLNQNYDLAYTMDLSTDMRESETVFTINDKVWPDTNKIKVNKDDLVKIKIKNSSKKDEHPMHLHGHFFQVLSKNGSPISGSPLMKDTLNLKPGEEYIVAFKADNPGHWMFHCHDLHHASAGMVTQVKYNGYTPDFTIDQNAQNQPE